MALYFISDLHLSEDHPTLFECFKRFLETIKQDVTALYILGDFFEYWIGDDAMTPYQKNIIDVLAKYSAEFPIYFMPGNRDFLLGRAFYQQSGVIPLLDPSVIQHQHQKVLLLHGDSLCMDHFPYRCYRTLARISTLQVGFLHLPLFLRQKIALKLRGQDTHVDEYARDLPEKMRNRLMQENPVNWIIHGHSHYPVIEHDYTTNCSRYGLAAWGKQGNTLKIDDTGLTLFYFS